MKINKTIIEITSTVVFIALIFLLFSYSSCENKQQPSKIILAENPVPLSSITIIAKDKGFFSEEGLDVEVRNLTTGKLCLDAVIGGGADFATVAETPLMRAGFADQKVNVSATIASSNNDCKVIARKDKGISEPKDLKGKKVATVVGTSADFFMSSFLTAKGLSTKDVSVTNLQPPDMVTALIRGDIDAFFIFEPHIYNAKKQLGDNAIIFTGQDVYTETFNIAVTEKFANENPDTIKRFLNALIKAENFIKTNKEEAIAIVSKRTGMDSNILSEIWGDFRFEIVLEPSLLDYMNKEGQWAVETGTATGSTIPDYRKMIRTKELQELKPGAVTIK